LSSYVASEILSSNKIWVRQPETIGGKARQALQAMHAALVSSDIIKVEAALMSRGKEKYIEAGIVS